ncbi:hypothetical protein D3C87_1037870 [compost metagenome]
MIYRFRTADSLLGRFNELEKQEIYFASPKELNDPMEGFKDIFWKGDDIVWKNFFINYIKSLERFFSLMLVSAESIKLTEKDIRLTHQSAIHPPEHTKIVERIVKEVFDYPFIASIPKSLSNREGSIRRDELLSYVNFFHQNVINAVSKVYFENGYTDHKHFYNESKELNEMHGQMGNMVEITNLMVKESGGSVVDSMFSILTQMIAQTKLNAKLAMKEKDMNTNGFFLISEFPEKYLALLEESIYPDWYSASFLTDNTNSAIWGHYGDNHKGICLMFKTQTNEKNEMFLNLDVEYGANSEGVIRGMRQQLFHKVEYTQKHTEIDFFRSIGRLNRRQLNSLWYKDELGNLSECGLHVNSENKDEWIEGYWNNYYKSITAKLDEWSYEKEYRLILSNNFHDYSTIEERKLKYDFNDLQGIIFGIKTDISDKLKIIKIAERKCRENNREGFDFFQAFYSKATGKIDSYKLDTGFKVI